MLEEHGMGVFMLISQSFQGLDEKSLRHKNLGQKTGGRFLFSQTRFVANVSQGLRRFGKLFHYGICMIEFVMCVGAHPNVQSVVSTFEWAQVLYRLAKYHGMIGGTISLI